MKLEIKHLAPYLPYGLTGKTKKEFEPWKIVGFKEDSFSITEPTLLCTHPTYNNVINIWSRNIKPILRPLSDLTKDEFNFIWNNEIDFESLEQCVNTADFETNKFSFDFWQLLFENHFDVFGLIDAGLAIDITTVTN